MKKFLTALLALTLVLSVCAFGVAESVNPDDIADTMTSESGAYELAFVTDVGQLKDKSFNQGTFDGVKLYANANGLSYKYYQPANGDQATDDDRYDAMKAAVEGGAKVVVCAGFMQGTALTKAATEFADTNFVFIDGWPLTKEDGTVLTNVAPIAFKEEQAGYFAGYVIVMEGFTKLGFAGGGGGTNAACCRYGSGFVQGAEAAAAVKGVDVEIKYSWLYGSGASSTTLSAPLSSVRSYPPNTSSVPYSCVFTSSLKIVWSTSFSHCTSTSSGTAFGFTCSTCVKACRIVMFFTSSYKNQGRRAFLPVAPV